MLTAFFLTTAVVFLWIYLQTRAAARTIRAARKTSPETTANAGVIFGKAQQPQRKKPAAEAAAG